MGLGLYKLGLGGTVRIEVLMVGDAVAHRRWGGVRIKVGKEATAPLKGRVFKILIIFMSKLSPK